MEKVRDAKDIMTRQAIDDAMEKGHWSLKGEGFRTDVARQRELAALSEERDKIIRAKELQKWWEAKKVFA